MLVVGNIVIGLLLGFGAIQELVVRGIRGGEPQPLVVGLAGAVVSLLFLVSAVALWRELPWARRLAGVAAVGSIAFHAYAALPPHRNAGILALVIGVGYGLFVLWQLRRPPASSTHRVAAA